MNTQNKKVIFYLHNSARISGAEISLELLIKKIDTQQYDIVVLLPLEKGPFYKLLKQEKIQVIRLPIIRFKRTFNPFSLLKYLFSFLICFCALSYYFLKYKVTLLHANNTISYLYAFLPCWLCDIPCIWHIRDTLPPRLPITLLKQFAATIFCISRYVIPKSMAYYHKMIVLYNAVDLAQMNNIDKSYDLRRKMKLPDDTLFIAQVGQLIPWKNHTDFVLAAELLVKHVQNICFLFIGRDLFNEYSAYRNSIEYLISKKKLTAYFFFIHYEPGTWNVLKEIDILFHPASCEPFGRIIIEAMALQKPVISVNSGGPSEIIRENVSGYFVNEHDIHDMAAKMLLLIKNKDLRYEMGRAGKTIVDHTFDISVQSIVLQKTYQQLSTR